MHITPYLSFDGNAREAMETYRDILGGDLVVVTFADSGQAAEGAPHADKVMHSVLTAGDVHVYAGDWVPDFCGGAPYVPGADVTLTLWGYEGEAAALRRAFERLAEGGQVAMPLSPQPWGQEFGSLRDRFGKGWNVAIYGEAPI